MLAKLRYKKALSLVSKWPLDPSKGTRRDLGALFRAQVQHQFRDREDSLIEDPQLCDKMLQSLDTILSDKYRTMYSLDKDTFVSSLGMPLDVTQFLVSDEGLALMRKEAEMGVMRRIFHQVTGYRYRQYNKYLSEGQELKTAFQLHSGPRDDIQGIESGEENASVKDKKQ